MIIVLLIYQCLLHYRYHWYPKSFCKYIMLHLSCNIRSWWKHSTVFRVTAIIFSTLLCWFLDMTLIRIFNVFIYETNLFVYYSMRNITFFWHCFFTMLTQNLVAFIFVFIYNIGIFRLHRVYDSACSGIIDIFRISIRRGLPDKVNWTYYILIVRFKLFLARIFMFSPYNVLQIRFIGIVLAIIVFLFRSLAFATILRYNMLQVLIVLLNYTIIIRLYHWHLPPVGRHFFIEC